MYKLTALQELKSAIEKATVEGVFDDMASDYIHPDTINEFCDCVLLQYFDELEKQRKLTASESIERSHIRSRIV